MPACFLSFYYENESCCCEFGAFHNVERESVTGFGGVVDPVLDVAEPGDQITIFCEHYGGCPSVAVGLRTVGATGTVLIVDDPFVTPFKLDSLCFELCPDTRVMVVDTVQFRELVTLAPVVAQDDHVVGGVSVAWFAVFVCPVPGLVISFGESFDCGVCGDVHGRDIRRAS